MRLAGKSNWRGLLPICKKCGMKFPNRVEIDGTIHVVSNRKYCLTCSPFNRHNTKRLHMAIGSAEQKSKIAVERVQKRRRTLKEMSVSYKGGMCCICGYNRCITALEFHHIDPNSKSFGLSERGFTRKWDVIKSELDKCILVCANCHREIEAGLIKIKDTLK